MTGLILSCISSIIVLATVFIFFYKLVGKSAAWGCLLGLFSSHIFVSFSAFATSDLFCLAIFSSCFLFFFLAVETKSNVFWAISGILLGFGLLARSNSLTLLVLLVLPWIQNYSLQARFKKFLWLFGSLIFVLFLWFIYAKYD